MRNVLDGMEQLTRMGAKRQGIWVKPKRLPRAFNMLLATCCRKPGELSSRSTNRTAVYGPVRTVVWEGSDREVAPYPDYEPIRRAEKCQSRRYIIGNRGDAISDREYGQSKVKSEKC